MIMRKLLIIRSKDQMKTTPVLLTICLLIFFTSVLLNIPLLSRRPLYDSLINFKGKDSFLENNQSIGKVFIGINLYQSESLLYDGRWTHTMIELIDYLGSDNVYLSIYENNSTDTTPQLLKHFAKQIKCKHQIVTSKIYLDHSEYDSIHMEDRNERYVSRIGYLASIRNHLLKPLMNNRSTKSGNENRHFSKILFLNDIIFSLDDVLRLLRTNNGDYSAVCALDFINPIKFYDTFATRDSDGYSMGFILYPFFSPGNSQREIREGNELVRVKSCWSGMVVFDSKPFENGLKFRSLINQSNWDASECCLIHADINQPNRTFINPIVRVAYSSSVYQWQKRFAHLEILWYPIQRLITSIARLPRFNPHRTSPNDGFCWTKGKKKLSKPH